VRCSWQPGQNGKQQAGASTNVPERAIQGSGGTATLIMSCMEFMPGCGDSDSTEA